MTKVIITNFVGINFGTIHFQVQKPTTHSGNPLPEPSSFVRSGPSKSPTPALPTNPTPKVQMLILQEFPFSIPSEGAQVLFFTLPNEFLLEMVDRGLKDPSVPLKIVNSFVGVINFGTVRFPPKNENPEAK